MKKKVITLLLSFVLASGSIGISQVLAADTTGQEAEPVQEEETPEQEEEPVQEEEPAENTDTGNAAEDVSGPEEEEEPVKENEEQDLEDKGFETEEAVDEEETDTSEDAAAEVLETEETEITDESEDAMADVVYSGRCGENATWTLTDTGLLTISGSGPMYDDDDNWPVDVRKYPSTIYKVVIEDGITTIGDRAFEDCYDIKSITIPKSIMRIGYYAFDDCINLKKIYISDLGAWCRISNYNHVPGDLYLDGKLLTEVVVPDGIRIVAFANRDAIKRITLPNSVIGINGCTNCKNLTSINIPDSVTYISAKAFLGCSSLKSLTIPDSVTEIGYEAFPSKFWELQGFVVLTHSSYVKDYCKKNGYVYFDNSAPPIANLTSHNGSDIRVYFEKRDEAEENYVSDRKNIVGYQIKYADNKNMTGAKSVFTKDKKAVSIVITGLKNGKTYYVQIQHYLKKDEGSYWSKWSPIKSVTVGQTPYKTPITKLSTYIGSHIKVDWTKTAGASGYHIKYADNSSMTGAKEVMVKGNSTFTKTLTGLKNGKTYYVKIQTYRTVSGKTYWSSWSPAKSIKVDQKPYGSSISKLTNPSSKAMKITWDKASSSSGYHIQYATNSNMTGAKDITINNKDTLSKTVTGLTKGKTYYVRIQTFRKVSGKTYWSSWSKAKQIKITK